MYHQIQHHAHIRCPFLIDAEPVRFNEQRLFDNITQRHHGRVETFEMTHLDDQPLGIGKFYQLIGLGQSSGHRFFNQNIHIMGQKIFAHGKMRRGWNYDADGINRIDQVQMIGKSFRFQLLGNGFGCGPVKVNNPDKFDIRHPGIFFGMVLAQIAGADNTDTEFSFDFFHFVAHILPFESPK